MKRAALAIFGSILAALACSASCEPGHESSPFGAEGRDLLSHPVSVEILPVMGRESSGDALAMTYQVRGNGRVAFTPQ